MQQVYLGKLANGKAGLFTNGRMVWDITDERAKSGDDALREYAAKLRFEYVTASQLGDKK